MAMPGLRSAVAPQSSLSTVPQPVGKPRSRKPDHGLSPLRFNMAPKQRVRQGLQGNSYQDLHRHWLIVEQRGAEHPFTKRLHDRITHPRIRGLLDRDVVDFAFLV